MSRSRRELLVLKRDDGAEVLACPGPGRVRWTRRPGEALVPGSVVGVLVRGGRTFDLVVPPGAGGQVREADGSRSWRVCQHGAPLAVLGALESTQFGAAEQVVAEAGQVWEVRSPTHGTFYLRPQPGAPPYVTLAQEVCPGATLGLVEVMKCFSPITFDPPKGAVRGRVRAILAKDGAEVLAEQPLVAIELS